VSIYREYDIRGIFGKELTEERVKKIGYFLAERIKKTGKFVAVGYDARLHSPTLFEWLCSGFRARGVVVLNMGMVPTGVNYFCNYQSFETPAGTVEPAASVMITGSHNPPEYNGFKITIDKKPFFAEDIYSLGEEVENSDIKIDAVPEFFEIDAKERYIDYMVEEFGSLRGFDKKIAIDCGNGVAGVVAEPILKGLGISYEALFCEPNGTFPNHHPDPSVEENLKALKDALKVCDLGFAFDGDGDRIAFLTPQHSFKGDELAIVFARYMSNPVVVGEVKCSQVMYDEIDKIGKALMYKTGHSNLKVYMKKSGADLAAEVSGHIFFADRYYGYDDAVYAMLRILELSKKGVDFDAEIASVPKVFNTPEIKYETTEEKKFKIVSELKDLLSSPPEWFPGIVKVIDIDGVRVVFEKGWGLVRASNTTPVLAMRFESFDEDELKKYETALKRAVEEIDKKVK